MRSDDMAVESPLMAPPGLMDVYGSFISTAPKEALMGSIDLVSYSKILQNIAKIYPNEQQEILNSPFSEFYNGIQCISENQNLFPPWSSLASNLLLSDKSISTLNSRNFPIDNILSEQNPLTFGNDKALDLSVQRICTVKPQLRRITLNQVKHKVVEDVWVENDTKLLWKDSKIAAFNPAQKLFMCLDCEHIGFLSRVAEHWLGSHANLRVFHCPRCPYTSAWSRCVKMHLTRHHNEQSADTTMWKGNPLLTEVTGLLQDLRTKVESRIDANNLVTDKRFYCPHCPYATDRRDLYTRHENIHKDEKPFHCYVCFKQFNRADHVKKHFIRMHADVEYDISKIRKKPNANKTSPSLSQNESSANNYISTESVLNKLKGQNVSQSEDGSKTDSQDSLSNDSIKTEKVENDLKVKIPKYSENSNKTRKKGEKLFMCHYCSWSGNDNWCLKRHMNTHIKPFACVLCDYKAARAERLSTHVFKVHNKRICNKCNFLAETQEILQEHTKDEHHNNPYSRRHICTFCGMSFDTKANLETHMHMSHRNTQSPEDIVEITPIMIPSLTSGSTSNGQYESLSSPLKMMSTFTLAQNSIKDCSVELFTQCPHCEYKLRRDEVSKEHWLVHHEEVCSSCVHVYTSAYGPQVWKKVVDRPTDQIFYSKDVEMKPMVVSQENPINHDFLPDSRMVQTPEPIETCLVRSTKRPRKQSYPKKIVPVLNQCVDNKAENNKFKKRAKRLIFYCKYCKNRPKFTSLLKFKSHIRKHKRQR